MVSERVVEAFEQNVYLALWNTRDVARQGCLNDVLAALTRTKSSVCAEIQQRLRAEFVQLFEVCKNDRLANISLNGASLMETADLNASLSFAEITDGLETHLRMRSFELEQRLSNLRGRTIHRANNPLSVERVCRVCHDVLLERWPQPFLREYLGRVREGLKTPLSQLYDKLIAFLSAVNPLEAVKPLALDRSLPQ